MSATGSAGAGGDHRTAQARVDEASTIVLERLGAYVWAEGDTTWSAAIGERLGELGWRLAIEEIGTGGQLAALFGDVEWLALVEGRPHTRSAAGPGDHGDPGADVGRGDGNGGGLLEGARRVRSTAGVQVGLAVSARPRGSELAVSVAIVTPDHEQRQTRTTYTGGSLGRTQAALLAAATLATALRDASGGRPDSP